MPSYAQLESSCERPAQAADEEGYMLLGLIVAIAILLLWLAVAATNAAFAIRRDREAETARRADQYVRAIRLYYKKFGHYPGSIEQLEKSNNIRFLRRRWIDPLTGTTDWRTIAVGQNKTTPKGFFGEPLAGLPTSGLGALAGSQSQGMPGSTTPGAPAGANPPGGLGLGTPGTSLGAPSSSPPSTPAGTGAPAGTTSVGAGATSAPAASSATDATTAAATTGGTAATGNSPFGSSGVGGNNTGVFMGVGTNATGNSILEINGETTYQNWEFLYDPRVELLRLKQQLNSGMQTNGAGTFGQAPGSNPQGSTAPGATAPLGSTPFGTTAPSGSAPSGTAPAGTTPPSSPGGSTPNQ